LKNQGDPQSPGRLSSFFTLKDVFTLRNTVVMGMLLAIGVVLDQFSIYITPTFKAISFAYLPGVMVSMLFGPWAAILYGFAFDSLGFFINSHGNSYFFGYALTAMVTYLIYAVFMYQRPVKVWRVAIARGVVLLAVVFGLNFLWDYMMYHKAAGAYFTGVRLVNNLVQYPFHVVLTAFLARYVQKLYPHVNKGKRT